MPIEKPLPLMVGNKAYYSLTSYDPVEISVDVPYTSEADVDYALEMTVRELGGTLANLDDPAWAAEHFDGMSDKAQIREAVRQQVSAMNAQIAEQQKVGKCVEALSARLAQSIPPQHLEEAKNAIKARFVQQLQAEGLTPDQFLARSGTSAMQLEAMFDRQAQQMAEGDAALSAVAHERKLKVDEMEYGRLLGLAPDALNQVMEQARAAGQLDDLREAALRAKAAQLVVAECACTYNHETAAQAEARIRQYRQMEQMFAERFEKDEPTQEQEPPASNGNGFKLV